LLLPATLSVMFASFYTGAAAGLRALGVARRSLKAQLLASSAYLVGGVGGGALGGALGSAWGAAGATFFAVIVWWSIFRIGVRERRHELESEPADEEDRQQSEPAEVVDRQDLPEMRTT
jgi:hypothetical protein